MLSTWPAGATPSSLAADVRGKLWTVGRCVSLLSKDETSPLEYALCIVPHPRVVSNEFQKNELQTVQEGEPRENRFL